MGRELVNKPNLGTETPKRDHPRQLTDSLTALLSLTSPCYSSVHHILGVCRPLDSCHKIIQLSTMVYTYTFNTTSFLNLGVCYLTP
ncbi:hypothetical protein AFLA_001586 [Aspergillus flavus NRRL3357]|nr:hypothetical protein AFLA_001586 [Aspergillus flavus NRRL3357]